LTTAVTLSRRYKIATAQILDGNLIYKHIEELNDLYSLPNIVRVVKSRRMRWAGHVVCIGEEQMAAQGVGG
jgi:hypothetical protein